MSAQLLEKIDLLIEENTEKLISDTIKLVNINSERTEALPGAPFGKGPREVLDTVLKMGESEGFATTDYGVGVISLGMKKGQPDLGIWAHGDVVPAGEGWTYGPYNATLYKNCIIGRGATDNKGQLASIFNLFRIFKELGIELNYNAALYVGSAEEGGMWDMKGIDGNPDAKGFINVCTPPKMSLVPDSGFPLAYGARGLTYFKIKSKKPLKSCTITAGLDNSPGKATAVFNRTDLPDNLPECTVVKGENTTIETFVAPKHAAQTNTNGNMITKLLAVLMENNLVCEEDKEILNFFKEISLDNTGAMFDINVPTKIMKSTYVSAVKIEDADGFPKLTIRIGYPIDITLEQILDNIKNICEPKGYEVIFGHGHRPYINDNNTEVVKALVSIANEITGDDAPAYICGSTYAHYLPNAYVYGMNGCCPPEDFPKGRGGAHGIDECVSIERLKRAMRIYARALLKLNDIEW